MFDLSGIAERVASVGLQVLAQDPEEALRQWGKLSQAQKLELEGHMKRYYGAEFARQFRQRASSSKRPDASTFITNDPSLTPAKLRSMGYRFKDNKGGVAKWVHPSGKEIWLLSPPKGAEPSPVDPPSGPPSLKPPTHPDVEDSHKWADDLEARKNQLWEDAIRLKNLKRPDGSYPSEPFNEYFRKLKRFTDDRQSVLDQEAPIWRGSPLTDEEREDLEKQIQRIEKTGDFPPEMEELGTF